ncbi:organic hydroperoxide resistance protein [Tamlana nanhaiensis]|uniref:Organic hydroperoxide resistance protein n=1 Tax=Neotamlana nanhaiensis TaxID=1382798 RepID=A0A0D7W623_9FLAO|nr:organic hydroperoxide resistance protein [Tamlana nanhaiensis]KJD34479.1 organic hydroperoxide resistance protein [Tamlana nanhaiensis]
MKKIYSIGATATGGRNGHVKSDNGILDLEVRHPKALGGENDNYANPEMLFAAGYSACFDSALNLVINNEKAQTGTTTVTANVAISKLDNGGFGLAVELQINVPNVSIDLAQNLADKAHQICPYSNATRNNIDVKLTVTNNS